MDEKLEVALNEWLRDRWRFLAGISVVIYAGAMAIIFFSDLKAVFEPPLLLPVMNTVFAGLIPIAVSIIAARSYLFSGLNSLLFMGCGMMTFGCGAILAGWLIGNHNGPNVNVTIYNTAALLGAVFHVLGAILTFKKDAAETMTKLRKLKLSLAYTGMLLLLFALTLATLRDITPVFFIQGVGPTLVRQYVLGTAVLLFLLSTLVIMGIFKKSRSAFHYWYALSLLMIALGLTAFLIQKSVGSPIGWLGRSGQYIGSIYALIAILITVRSARIKGVSIPSVVADLFWDAKLSYQALVETVMDPIISFKQNGKIVQWNSAAEKVFGYRQNEAIGSSLFDVVLSEAHLEIFRMELDHLIAIDELRKVGRTLEIYGKTKAGGIIPLDISITAMKAGHQWSFICVFRDITERKKAATEIRELNEELEIRIEEKTADLRKKNTEMVRFIYTVSHELKTPLVTVKTFLGYLEKDLADGNAEQVAADIGFMRSDTDKMVQLLADVVEMTKTGRAVNAPESFTLREVVDEALAAVQGRIFSLGVVVKVEGGRIDLHGDRRRLSEVWRNLVENAVKYMGDQAAPRIELGIEVRDDATIFYVRDNGIGIDPRYQVKVFGLFDKLDPKSEGTGLGLALVKSIVELHKGNIWLESEGLGKGTCFKFTLPIAMTNYALGIHHHN